MKPKIELESRYHEIHTLTRIGDENSCYYKVEPADDYIRLGQTDTNRYSFIDFSGGPMITEGTEIDGHKVKSIYSAIIIEFKE